MAGKLYIVPTPVGNLEDMSVRAVNVLKSVDMVLAEDTRTSGVLMKHFGIATPMSSHHKFNEHDSLPNVTARLQSGSNLALRWKPCPDQRLSCPRLSIQVCLATVFALRASFRRKKVVPPSLLLLLPRNAP